MNTIEDTFLKDSEFKYSDSPLNISCDTHKAPAVFFSNKFNKYQCLKCLIEEQELVYIDKRFKQEMDDFERIKHYLINVIKSRDEKSSLTK